MDNVICILSTNMRFLDTMLKNMENPELYYFVVINEVRCGDKREQIRNLLEKYEVKQYEIHSSLDLCKKYVSQLELSYNGLQFFKSHKYGAQLLMLPFVLEKHKKVLFIDDDVLLLKGFENLFKIEGISFSKGWGSSALNTTLEKHMQYNRKMNQLAGSFEEFDKHYLYCGNMLWDSEDMDLGLYLKMLRYFYNCEAFQKAWFTWMNGGPKNRGFMLTMYFIVAYCARHFKGEIDWELGRYITYNVYEGKSKKSKVTKPCKPILHYYVRNKETVLDMLIDAGYIQK